MIFFYCKCIKSWYWWRKDIFGTRIHKFMLLSFFYFLTFSPLKPKCNEFLLKNKTSKRKRIKILITCRPTTIIKSVCIILLDFVCECLLVISWNNFSTYFFHLKTFSVSHHITEYSSKTLFFMAACYSTFLQIPYSCLHYYYFALQLINLSEQFYK